MRELPKILATRLVTPRYQIEQMDLEFSNGAHRTYERIHGSGREVVVIVPMLDAHTVLLSLEYSAGLHRYELGLPSGRIDRGETVLEGANRELKEEIGFGARDLRVLKRLSMAPTFMSHTSHLVLARDLFEERLEGDEPEELQVQPFPIDDLERLLDLENFSASRSIAALFLAREWLRREAQS